MATCKQVDSLVQAYLDHELAPSEQGIFEEHLAACPECATTLAHQKDTAALLHDVFADHKLARDFAPNVLAHLPEMDPTRAVRELNARSRGMKSSPWFTAWMPAAAALVLAILGVALFISWPDQNLAQSLTVGMVTGQNGVVLKSVAGSTDRDRVGALTLVRKEDRFETQGDSTVAMSLAGPTHVKVASNSRYKVFDSRRLSVERGRAWFSVSKERRTFRVMTPTGDITVWGTVFGVEVTGNSTIVTVEHGEVTVEYGQAFTVLRDNTQVTVEMGATQLVPRPVDALAELAWVQDIQVEPKAELAFAEMVPARTAKIIPAEQYFVLDVQKNSVQSINFQWEPHTLEAGYAGYDVYFYDDVMSPLMIKHIDSHVFANRELGMYELNVANEEELRNVNVLHLKVVPDKSQGELETSFSAVHWVPGQE